MHDKRCWRRLQKGSNLKEIRTKTRSHQASCAAKNGAILPSATSQVKMVSHPGVGCRWVILCFTFAYVPEPVSKRIIITHLSPEQQPFLFNLTPNPKAFQKGANVSLANRSHTGRALKEFTNPFCAARISRALWSPGRLVVGQCLLICTACAFNTLETGGFGLLPINHPFLVKVFPTIWQDWQRPKLLRKMHRGASCAIGFTLLFYPIKSIALQNGFTITMPDGHRPDLLQIPTLHLHVLARFFALFCCWSWFVAK